MKKLIWIILGIVIVLMVILKLINNKKISENKVYKYDKNTPILVKTETIKLKDVVDSKIFTGIFEPNKETKINAEIQGKINSITVDVGSIVSSGQTIIQLDNSLLKLQLQSVEVQIEGFENDINRYTVLSQADAIQGVQLEKAKLALKSAKIQKASLQEQINKTSIKAPFNGVVTAKLNEIGGFASQGVPLLQISDLNSLKFTINVPENDLNNFQLGQQFLISVDALPDIKLMGKLLLIGSKANLGNSFPVQFFVTNTKSLSIKSGMFGKVKISSNKSKKGIIIPSSAIINETGIAQVYIVKKGKAILKTITISENIGNKTIVLNGLSEGDTIVINGFINLFDGANIRIKD